MAYREIETLTGDLRATKDDIGSFLTVDESCNLVWTDSRITASGGVWEYNVVEDDSYIVLPQAKLNAGMVVAIMRSKTTIPRDEGHGINSNKSNAKIVLLPYNYGTTENPDYDYIQGGPNIYCSSGITWNFSTSSFNETTMEYDEFSSIILKSVYVGDGHYSWVIINGVGVWNAESLNEEPRMYQEAMNTLSPFSVSVQTAGVNSLSAGINTTDTQFVPILNIASKSNHLKVIPEDGVANDRIGKLLPQDASLEKPNTFIVGRFTDNFTGVRNVLYSEFGAAGANVNVFGPTNNRWSDLSQYPKVTRNELNEKMINFLGYIYDKDTLPTAWWAGNDVKSFSKKVGIRHKGTMTNTNVSTLGVTQIIVQVNLDEISLKNQVEKSKLRSIYAMLHSFFEISNDYTMPYTNVFKVPANVFSAKDALDSDIVVLSSSGIGETNSDAGFGSIVNIPLTEEDQTNRAFNIVFEFMYRPSAVGTGAKQLDTLEAFKALDNASNQYCILNFFGVEQLKSVSISPEVSFAQLSLTREADVGRFDGPSNIRDAYLDAKSNSVLTSGNDKYVGIVIQGGSYDAISHQNASSEVSSFFGPEGRFYPSDNVTKTVIEYDTGFSEVGDSGGAMKATLVIDWTGREWQFNGKLKYNGEEYIASKNAAFTESIQSIDFYQGQAVAYQLTECIWIQHNGMLAMPWFVNGSTAGSFNLEGRMNITNYKTVVHQTGSIETLMHYKCGWERAENAWSEYAICDGSENDLLISDYSMICAAGTEGTTLSPSKLCITPSHFMQKDTNPIQFDRDTDTIKGNRALLPYLSENDKNLRYFSTQFGANNGKLSYMDTVNKSSYPVAINDFCELKFTPKSTGTLVCDIDLPIDLGLSATGYFVLKQKIQTGDYISNEYGDYYMVKDSGANINAFQNSGMSTLKIHFTDSVIADQRIKYTIFIYDTPYVDSTLKSKSSQVFLAQNSAISRYRTTNDKRGIGYAGINDLKTLFETASTGTTTKYNGTWSYPANDPTKKVKSLFIGRDFDSTGDTRLREELDVTSLDIDKFAALLFNQTTTSDKSIIGTTKQNIGSTFSFHAYVLKDIVSA